MVRTALILSLFIIPAAAFGEMYRCQGKDGTAYQETPCKGGTKLDIPEATVNSRDSRIENAISLRKVVIGMTSEQAIRAWGKPTKVNKTIGVGYSSEQWVYDNGAIGRSQYLYFDNGVLRSMQGPNE